MLLSFRLLPACPGPYSLSFFDASLTFRTIQAIVDRKLPQLKDLNLNGATLSDEEAEVFLTLPALKSLMLSDSVSEQIKEKLSDKLGRKVW